MPSIRRRTSFPAVLAAAVGACVLAVTVSTTLSGMPPPAKGGSGDLIGTRAPEWRLDGWLNSKPLKLADLRGKVVLVRWWTAPECPHCAATAPVLNEFHKEYADKGLVIVGVYHHKSRTPLKDSDVAAHAQRLGFQFPVAIDREWTTLKQWWLETGDRPWTSVSFLIDRQGVIRHIHEGGRYEKGSDDAKLMEEKIKALLGEG
ncbi:TlpA disulfide reductase family protein [Roseimicrobium sp. ORNL1]|uniref:peroxiredoxin family protein n=1 Tax=Roseimicrobium sp. ORNL1 TaxID=2711231 RepID=UPI0013E1327B|nr:TlpA disulfide reductase family protein [Roseimicrobium sp. ORNL1]QIF05129.1 TlpA family protein disulfide reductase [Roseimicrobium sp. ORNL1]